MIIDKFKIIDGEEYELAVKNQPEIKIDDIGGIGSLIFPVATY